MALQLLEEAQALQAHTVALRREIHRHPELGLHLPRTQAAALDSLQHLDLELALSSTTSGVVATLRGAQPGPAVLLRGDMDALPMPEDTGLPFASAEAGCMHACGHDAHTAMLASAAHLLHAHRERIAGSVRFMFQPGEEGPGGAKPMLDEGLLDADGPPQAVYALHVEPELQAGMIACRTGPILAACDTISARLVGQGGHGSMPHNAIDPVPVACEVVQAIQTLVTRRFDVFDPVVATVGRIQSGTTSNVIPQYAELDITLRSLSVDARERLAQGVERLLRQIPSAHGLEVTLELEHGYPPTVNHASGEQAVAQAARAVLGEAHYLQMPTPWMGAEDFSYVLERFPGALAFIGAAPEEGEAAPCHSSTMQLNEAAFPAGVALYAALALQVVSPDPV
ncbi:MAG: M20 family metallopeptidase [Arenicellales bacterium]|jgi:hippurate hydrolase|nr:M20 family metallopeptidase [Arenicellales bacterium]